MLFILAKIVISITQINRNHAGWYKSCSKLVQSDNIFLLLQTIDNIHDCKSKDKYNTIVRNQQKLINTWVNVIVILT